MADDQLLRDLLLTRRAFDQEVSARDYVDLTTGGKGDLATLDGRANLAQAILNRLLTRRGELTELGHAEYGSRLHELIGEPNNLRLRAMAEVYIRECLAQEPRIQTITHLVIEPPDYRVYRDSMRVSIGIQPAGGEAPFTLQLRLP